MLLLAACGGDEQGATLPTAAPRYPEEVLRAASPEQKAAVADGEVSFAEYEQAVFATVSCLKKAGVEVEPPVLDEERELYTFTFGGVRTEAEVRFMDAAYQGCYAEHQFLVDDVWARQHGPTPQQEAEAFRALARCLRDEGIPASTDPSPEELSELSKQYEREYQACFGKTVAADAQP